MKSNKTVDGFQSRLDKAKQRISKSEDRPEINYIYIWNEAWRDKRMENKDERIKDIEKNSKMNINVSQNHRERCGTGAIFEEIMAENCPK